MNSSDLRTLGDVSNSGTKNILKLSVVSQSSTSGFQLFPAASASWPGCPSRAGLCRSQVNLQAQRSRSEVGVGEHGVLLPHRAEAFHRVHELLVVHELQEQIWVQT